jgi:hypothetical protein
MHDERNESQQQLEYCDYDANGMNPAPGELGPTVLVPCGFKDRDLQGIATAILTMFFLSETFFPSLYSLEVSQ